jgi:hypothetical protein
MRRRQVETEFNTLPSSRRVLLPGQILNKSFSLNNLAGHIFFVKKSHANYGCVCPRSANLTPILRVARNWQAHFHRGEEKMRGKAVVACLGILAALSAPALAQRAGARVIADVPFRFHIGQQTFEAGVYSFASDKDVLWVAEGNGPAKARGFTNSFWGTSPAPTGQVVFNCYGEECFLFRVWFPDRDRGLQMLTSPKETKFQKRRETRVYIALLGKEAKR